MIGHFFRSAWRSIQPTIDTIRLACATLFKRTGGE